MPSNPTPTVISLGRAQYNNLSHPSEILGDLFETLHRHPRIRPVS